MKADPIRVKAQDLRPGMAVQAIVALSAEYSYLDSRRIAQLKLRFKGATATVVRNGNQEAVPIEAVYAGDHVAAITDLPAELGFGEIDAQMAAYLKEQGFRELMVVPANGTAPAEPEADAALHAPGARAPGAAPAAAQARPTTQAVPTFASAKTLQHKKTLAEARYFLERVEEGERERFTSTKLVQELFQQGRAGKYSIKPAAEAVETILRKDVSAAMAAVAGLKSSDQTYAHCIDMAVLFNEAANNIIKAAGRPTNDKVARSTLAAGFMHDIGKSKVPQEILDSTERFAPGSREMELMRSHVEHSARILTDAGADDTMVNVAHYHHVKTDTTLPASYPPVDYAKVLPMTRLAAIVDVYQALTGKRSYKKNWVPGKAVQYLRSLEGSEFDQQMLANFLKVIGLYPVGSLVRLSTGDLAFVVKIEGQPLERPVVAVVENTTGELLGTNPVVNLTLEPELSIAELVDHYEHFDESPEQPFHIFSRMKLI